MTKKIITTLLLTFTLMVILSACGRPPQVMAQERMFFDISLELLAEYELPKIAFKETPVGGLSGITYERQKNLFYAISDDRSNLAPARFYTLKLDLDPTEGKIKNIEIENVTLLRNETGETYSKGTIDPESIALSPRKTVFISSEGDPNLGIAPFIQEYDLETGQVKSSLPIPQRYLPNKVSGIQENLAFEALTLKTNSTLPDDPFRIFTATEYSLLQDVNPDEAVEAAPIRLMHYVINPIGPAVLVAEHQYLLDPDEETTINNGLSELVALEQEGYFLTLERTFGFFGAGAKIFQMVPSNATDTSRIESFRTFTEIQPLRKQLVLNLNDLGIYLDNLEGMTLGPRLSDGSQSLILVSDDNFKDDQITQFLLFKIIIGH